jgi:phosphoribosylpyrophosphate synthetase
MIFTDTVCCIDKKDRLPGLEIVQSAELASEIIKTIINNESMSKLLRPFDASVYLENKIKKGLKNE